MLQYVGHATTWDDVAVRVSLDERRAVVFYLLGGVCAPPSASAADPACSAQPLLLGAETLGAPDVGERSPSHPAPRG